MTAILSPDSISSQHWATSYIGCPWKAGDQGPESFDCWGFVRWVLLHHYHIKVPEIIVDEIDRRALLLNFRQHPERQRWQSINCPQEGNAVLIRQSRYPVHVGLWLDVDEGGIIHCTQGMGVVFQKVRDLKLMHWEIEGFYRYCGNTAYVRKSEYHGDSYQDS